MSGPPNGVIRPLGLGICLGVGFSLFYGISVRGRGEAAPRSPLVGGGSRDTSKARTSQLAAAQRQTVMPGIGQRPVFVAKRCTREVGSVDYDGDLLDDVPNPVPGTAETCHELCSTTLQCNAYAFVKNPDDNHELYTNKSHNLCYLKSSRGLLIPRPHSLSNFIVGQCGCRPDGCWHTKLVVTSYLSSPDLQRLIYSLYAQSFRPFRNVILVLGVDSLQEEQPPALYPVKKILPIEENESVVVIHEKSNHNLHGYAALHKYKDHPYVRAAGYLCMPGSATVDPGFEQFFRNINWKNDMRVIAGGTFPWAHVVAFGAGVVRAYGDSYATSLSDEEIIILETGGGSVRGVKPMPCWGTTVDPASREREGTMCKGFCDHAQRYRYDRFATHGYFSARALPAGISFVDLCKRTVGWQLLDQKSCPWLNHGEVKSAIDKAIKSLDAH